jgi:hypothetical protein
MEGYKMTISRAGLNGIAMGAIVMTGFGAIWALGGAFGFTGGASVPLIVVTLIVVAGLIVAIVQLWRHAEVLPSGGDSEEAVYGDKTGRWFGLVFTIEALAIFVAARVLSISSHNTLIAPVIALIVGIHFLPLAALFRVRAYYVTGTVLSLLAIICIVAVTRGLNFGGSSLFIWSSIVGIGSAVILWVTAIWIMVQGHKLLHEAMVTAR